MLASEPIYTTFDITEFLGLGFAMRMISLFNP
jgi:hypothetical protein